MRQWRVIGRHRWVDGAMISECARIDDDNIRRFIATIYGYRNWRIWSGDVSSGNSPHILATIMAKVVAIRERIVACDDSVFEEPQAW